MFEHAINKSIADLQQTITDLKKTRDAFMNHVTAADINRNIIDENRCLKLENSDLKKKNQELEKKISDMIVANITRPEEKEVDNYIKRIVALESKLEQYKGNNIASTIALIRSKYDAHCSTLDRNCYDNDGLRCKYARSIGGCFLAFVKEYQKETETEKK